MPYEKVSLEVYYHYTDRTRKYTIPRVALSPRSGEVGMAASCLCLVVAPRRNRKEGSDYGVKKKGAKVLYVKLRKVSSSELGWGGTPAKMQRRCPKVSSARAETSRGA